MKEEDLKHYNEAVKERFNVNKLNGLEFLPIQGLSNAVKEGELDERVADKLFEYEAYADGLRRAIIGDYKVSWHYLNELTYRTVQIASFLKNAVNSETNSEFEDKLINETLENIHKKIPFTRSLSVDPKYLEERESSKNSK